MRYAARHDKTWTPYTSHICRSKVNVITLNLSSVRHCTDRPFIGPRIRIMTDRSDALATRKQTLRTTAHPEASCLECTARKGAWRSPSCRMISRKSLGMATPRGQIWSRDGMRAGDAANSCRPYRAAHMRSRPTRRRRPRRRPPKVKP